jgi:ribosomal protein S18 acetylase RimI-like enzyme
MGVSLPPDLGRKRAARPGAPVPRSLVWATDIDVLPSDHVAVRRGDHLVVRSPSNPAHWFGNLLVFDDAPGPGDRRRWEEVFAAEFADAPEVRHRTFCWDRTDDALGTARSEFAAAGYDLERTVGLIATPGAVRPHPRANRAVAVRPLAPGAGAADEGLWDQVVEIQVAARDTERPSPESDREYREFRRRRLADLRELFLAGRGAWYVALLGDEVVGSCGIVVTDGRGRFQAVDTAQRHRRRGICSRLVVDAARHAAATYGAERLVIAADAEYHALGIYESLGFRAVERVAAVCRPPPDPSRRVAGG